MNFSNEVSMKFGCGTVEATFVAAPAKLEAAATPPPLNKAAAAATPNNAATHGMTIPQIAPVDKPLLLFL